MMKAFMLLVLLISCETKQYKQPPNPAFVDNSSTALFGSNLDFNGINSVTSVTDTSAIINWTDVDGAIEYYVYDVTDGIIRLMDKVQAPASSYAATKLMSGQEYTFMVRVKDDDAQLDNNLNKVTITTDAKPDAPYFMQVTTISTDNPTLEHDVRPKPTLLILGVRPGDTVTVYTDSSCSSANQIGEAIVEDDSSFVYFQTDTLPSVGNYNFYSKITNINDVDSDCSTDFAEYEYSICPDGYILIDVSSTVDDFLAQDFCVMKFEARAWWDGRFDTGGADGDININDDDFDLDGIVSTGVLSTYKPGSIGFITPWRNIDIQTAKDECRSLGEGYDLINIYEWMTIARDIEQVASNWSNNIIAAGDCIARGNNGLDDSCGYNYNGIDNRAESTRLLDADASSKALFQLSTGVEIWDFAGNVAEWVDFGNLNQDEVQEGPFDCDDSWSEFGSGYLCDFNNDEVVDLEEYFYVPGNPGNITIADYNSDYGLGQFEGNNGNSAVATARGGSYRNGVYAGIFSISFAYATTTASEEVGFRCVFRP